MTPETVAVIGLGAMGLPIARHLMTAGFGVVGYDPAPASQRRALDLGMVLAADPADAARRSDVALVVVGVDADVVTALFDDEHGLALGAPDGYVVAICSTVDPSTSLAAGARLAPRGVHVVDATLCRGEPAAVDATLLVMTGGAPEPLQRLEPVLAVLGRDVVRLGGLGAGQVGKMLNNYLLWAAVAADHEALRLGGRYGLDADALREALLLSSGANWALETWTRARPMPWAEEDMRILLARAEAVGLDLPLAESVTHVITDIKKHKAAWQDGAGESASMDAFTRERL